MARLNTITLLAMCALVAAVACQSQAGVGMPSWTTCDMATSPPISCADCNTRLICKPIGGLLRSCDNPLKPYCNNGICSAVKAAGC